MSKVDELVEWAAEIYWLSSYRNWSAFDWDKLFAEASDLAKEHCRDFAKQILSHPDLALIDRSVVKGNFRYDYGECQHAAHHVVAKLLSHGWQNVIPLAEAIKEMKE